MVRKQREHFVQICRRAKFTGQFVQREHFFIGQFDLFDIVLGLDRYGLFHQARPIGVPESLCLDLGLKTGKPFEEHAYNVRIELCPGSLLKYLAGFVDRFCRAKRPIAAKRVIGVGNGQNAGGLRNILSGQTIGVTGAVPALMMMAYGRHDGVVKPYFFEDRRPDDRMDLCFFEFGGGQRAGLAQNMIGHRQFADVMEQCSGPQGVYLTFAEAHRGPQPDRVDLRAADVAAADLVACVDRRSQCLDRCQLDAACLHYLRRLDGQAAEVHAVRQHRQYRTRQYDEAERQAKI